MLTSVLRSSSPLSSPAPSADSYNLNSTSSTQLGISHFVKRSFYAPVMFPMYWDKSTSISEICLPVPFSYFLSLNWHYIINAIAPYYLLEVLLAILVNVRVLDKTLINRGDSFFRFEFEDSSLVLLRTSLPLHLEVGLLFHISGEIHQSDLYLETDCF